MTTRRRRVPPTKHEARRPLGRPEQAVLVLRQFRQVFNAVKAHFQHAEKAAGLGGAQLWALSVIESRPGIGIGDLARAMDVHQTTASNLVKALLSLGLVESARSEPDRRAVQLQIRPAGRRVLRRAPGPFTGVLPEALARLDHGTLIRLHRDLAVLLDALQTDPRAARTPLAQI